LVKKESSKTVKLPKMRNLS